MKVLHIIKSLGRGGAEMLLPETLKVHHKEKFEFHYIYFLPWKNQLVDELKKHGGKVVCMNAANPFQMIFRVRKIVRYIRDNRIDLIHAHLPWAGIIGRLVHRLTRIPMLYTEHNKQERYHFVTRWINRLTFNWQSAAIAVSGDVKTSINKNVRIRIPIEEILNAVATDTFVRDKSAGLDVRRQLQIPDDSIVVGTIAVFRVQKRLREWLEVFASVAAGTTNIYALMVGDGPTKNLVVNEIDRLGLREKVFLPGLQSDVKPWLSAIDIFMMSSVFEGLPVALLEAMSMQCAVVATEAGGIREVLDNGISGITVPVDDWKKLGPELTILTKNPGLRTKFGEEARTRVVQQFGMKRMVKELEDLYNRYA